MKSINRLRMCYPNRKYILAFILMGFGLILFSNSVLAADVYVKIGGTRASGKSTADDWTNANCYSNPISGFAAMSAGDTMTIDDGSYTAHMYSAATLPPNGTSTSNMTIIKAKNIPCQNGYACNSALKVTFGEIGNASSGIHIQNETAGTKQYIKFQGIRFYHAGIQGITNSWSYIYFKQCAFMGTTTGNSMALGVGGTHYLIEDSLFYGMGRYRLTFGGHPTGGSGYNVCRRCVARIDYIDSSGDPIAGIMNYALNDNAYLNNIVIDGDSPTYWNENPEEIGGAFYSQNGSLRTVNRGSIAMNVAMAGIAYGVNNVSASNIITDFAAIKTAGGIGLGHGTVNRATFYNINTSNFTYRSTTQFNHLYFTNTGMTSWGDVNPYAATNVVMKTIRAYGLGYDSTRYGSGYGSMKADYLNVNGAGAGAVGAGYSATHLTTTDPTTNGLLYPVRIETGSTLATAGSGGGQMGANILKRIGHDGDFWGDTGWDQEQTENLWPWPYEDWVKAEMASMPATIGGVTMPSATRGFVGYYGMDGVHNTLTSYIWESLGTQIPSDIYGSGSSLNGQCGSNNGSSFSSLTTGDPNNCSVGSVAGFALNGLTYSWSCTGSNGGTTANCSATYVSSDSTPPTITSFTMPTSASSLTVNITSFSATDNSGVVPGYIVTESSSAPSASATGWSVSAPTSFTFSSAGTKTAYAWAKDAAGNVSNSLSSTVIIASNGKNYYVTQAGSDSGNCSEASPCKTLAKPVTLAAAGDTIWLADGTYPGITIDGTVTTKVKGTTGYPITIKAQGSNAIISGRDSSVARGNLYLVNTSYIVVDGLKTTGATGSLGAGIAVRFSDHVTIKNCTVYNNSWCNIFTAKAPNIIIDNNTVYGAGLDIGIYIADATASHDQPIVRNNISHHNYGAGIHMNGDNGGTGYFTGAVIENNISYSNGTAGSGRGTGISMDGVSNSIVRNNLVYDNHATGISMFIIDSLAGHGPSNVEVYNNTVDMPSDGRWCIRLANSAGAITLKNNILYNRNSANGAISTTNSTDIANLTSDYNIMVSAGTRIVTPNDDSSYYTFAQWQAQGKDRNSLSPNINTVFVSLGSDYHPATASPAINTGQTLTNVTMDISGNSRPQGADYDIGAYEAIVNSGYITPSGIDFGLISPDNL